jgi:hypothetical protein
MDQPNDQPQNDQAAAKSKSTHVLYQSKEKHSVPFDIQIAGEVIAGNWSRDQGHVQFNVPKDLVKGFEKHYHCQVGNVVRVE